MKHVRVPTIGLPNIAKGFIALMVVPVLADMRSAR